MNNICGKNGKCVNLYLTFYCDCAAVSFFHTGKFCENRKLTLTALHTVTTHDYHAYKEIKKF